MSIHQTASILQHMTMYLEENRLETLKNWVFADDQPCNAAKMAECGFYFVGNSDEPDAVRCFLCNKTLDGWEADDDPWAEHLKHARYCEFAKKKKPQAALTLSQLVDFKILQVEKLFEKLKEELEQEHNTTLDLLDSMFDSMIK